MAKGDKKKVQAQVDTSVARTQASNDNIEQNIVPQNQEDQNRYNRSADKAEQDYGDIMGQYKGFAQGAASSGKDVDTDFDAGDPISAQMVNYSRTGEFDKAMKGASEFADTGGFSEQDMSDLRARGVSPIRSTYANAMRNNERSKSLQGGYSPNYAAANAKMTRELPGQLADQVTNVNAGIAGMKQQGRLAGIGALGNMSAQDIEFGQNAALANQRADLAAKQGTMQGNLEAARLRSQAQQFNSSMSSDRARMQLEGIHGQQGMYGTSPGLTGMFANKVTNSNEQYANTGRMQEAIGDDRVAGQGMVAEVPSNFQVAGGRIRTGAKIAGQAGAAYMTGGASLMAPGGMIGS